MSKQDNQAQNLLSKIEENIINKMAAGTGYAPFQMKNMIRRCPELKAYYHQLRETVIKEMAA